MFDKYDRSQRKRGEFLFVLKKKITSKKEIDRLAHIYISAFDFFRSHTPCTQFYPKEEIQELIRDPEMIKYIIYHEDLAIGFGLATTNLRKVPWINFDFYWENFRSHIEKGILFYFKGIVIAPEFQNISIKVRGKKEVKLVAELFNFIASTFPPNTILAFDCSERINFWLCDAIMSSTGCFSSLPVNHGKTFVDRQMYHVLCKTANVKDL